MPERGEKKKKKKRLNISALLRCSYFIFCNEQGNRNVCFERPRAARFYIFVMYFRSSSIETFIKAAKSIRS